MNYYKLGLNQSNAFWKKYAILGDELYTDEEFLSEVALEDIDCKVEYFIEKLTDGILPDFCSLGTDAIIVKENLFFGIEVSEDSVSKIRVLEKTSLQRYLVLNVLQSFDCADLTRSDYEAWPSDANLLPWHNPIARHFIKPALYKDKIPQQIDAFKIKNWGGPFNIVITERFLTEILKIEKASDFLTFVSLDAS